METRVGHIRIGTSGYQYNHWRGVFYPEKTPKTRWFEYYAGRFDTVELNTTFYHLPRAETFVNWYMRAPADFIYALKFSRYGSHIRRLLDPADTVGLFMERARGLGVSLGPILVQLPPRWHADPERLDAFLAAARAITGNLQRWAVEFRDRSWLAEPVYDVLRRHNAALCIHDMLKAHPDVRTADWVYLRFHGADTWGNYPPAMLQAAAERAAAHAELGLDVYAFFNNDAHGYAVANARDMRRMVAELVPAAAGVLQPGPENLELF